MKQIRLTNEEIGTLCKALAHLVHAGIDTADALFLLAEDEQNAACRQVLSQMARLADDGTALSAAFRQSGCFPGYVCTLLEVAGRVGKTEDTLTALASYYENRAQMNRRLRSSLLYPAVLLAVLLAVILILLIWVLPIFNDVYAQLGSRLTGIAGGLLALGAVLRHSLPVIGIVLASAGVVCCIRPVRHKLLKLWQRHFGDRGAFGAINSARFVQAISMARSSGMTEQEAVSLAVSLSDDAASSFRKRCSSCLAALDSGASLSQALLTGGFLSVSDRRLLDAGNRSGSSDAMLNDISQRMTQQSEEHLERTVGKLEPALVAVACVLIGIVLLSVMLPLVNIMAAIG